MAPDSQITKRLKAKPAILAGLALVIAGLVLGGVLWANRQKPARVSTPVSGTSFTNPKRFKVTINQRKIVSGPSTFTVDQGDYVSFEFRNTDMDTKEDVITAEGLGSTETAHDGGKSVGNFEFKADRVGTFKLQTIEENNDEVIPGPPVTLGTIKVVAK